MSSEQEKFPVFKHLKCSIHAKFTYVLVYEATDILVKFGNLF
jgi:hypothetical protein